MNSIIKRAGGKTPLKHEILPYLRHSLTFTKADHIYVEPFLGGGSILLNLELSCKKYAFDIDKELILTWLVIQSFSQELQKIMLIEPAYEYNEDNFISAKYRLEMAKDSLPYLNPSLAKWYAADYIFVNRTSRSANMKDFGTSTRLRGKRNEYLNAYENAISHLLPLNALAIKDVIFDCGDYIELMEKYGLVNNNNVTAYFDPPYVHETRTCCDLYSYEFATYEKDVSAKGASGSHEGMIKFLAQSEITAYVSGYESQAYVDFDRQYLLPAGKKLRPVFTKEVSNNMGQTKKKSKRTEVLWRCN